MLQISNLNVYYGESHILRNVDLHVPTGKIVCLIGRNGVGKTTLMKSIIGLLSPRTGDIILDGDRINDRSPDLRARMGIGYVPQGREIIPRLTVEENLLLGLEAQSKGLRSTKIPIEIFLRVLIRCLLVIWPFTFGIFVRVSEACAVSTVIT